MLKTTMGMLGEYEYDTVYNEEYVPPVTWAVYVGFLVINCVIIVNLLVRKTGKSLSEYFEYDRDVTLYNFHSRLVWLLMISKAFKTKRLLNV